MTQPQQCRRGKRLAQRATRATLNIHILPTATAKARHTWARHARKCRKCGEYIRQLENIDFSKY